MRLRAGWLACMMVTLLPLLYHPCIVLLVQILFSGRGLHVPCAYGMAWHTPFGRLVALM